MQAERAWDAEMSQRRVRGERSPAGAVVGRTSPKSVVVVASCLAMALCGCGVSNKGAASVDADRAGLTAGEKCLTDAEVRYTPRADAPSRIDVEHILVRHAGVEGATGVTRTPEEACLRALEAWKKLQAGADWDSIVEEYTEAKGAAAGKLSRVSSDELDRDFAAVAFSLDTDELSYVVKTSRGFHLVLRR